jgi:hypothetical protein
MQFFAEYEFYGRPILERHQVLVLALGMLNVVIDE